MFLIKINTQQQISVCICERWDSQLHFYAYLECYKHYVQRKRKFHLLTHTDFTRRQAQSHIASSCKHKTSAYQQAKKDCKNYNTILISDIVSMLAISILIPIDTGPSAKKNRKSECSSQFFNIQCSRELSTKSFYFFS